MRTKQFVLLVLVMVLGFLVTACSGVAAAQDEPDTTPRTLNVTGSAKVYLTPDIVNITIGVHTEHKNPKEAVAANNTSAQKVKDAIKALGVADKDIQTTNFSIYPSQQYSPQGELEGTVYFVDNSVFVTLRDLTKIGDVLGAAIDAGANSISGISFDVEDKEAAISQARKDAVADAKQIAKELAEAAGVTLDQIQSISYSGGYPTPVFEGKGGGSFTANAEVPISPGQLTLTADVYIVYEIH